MKLSFQPPPPGTAHSPAPWQDGDHGDGQALCDAKGRRIASFAYGKGAVSMKVDIDECRSNFLLMKAAPDLLAALRNLLESTEWAGTVIGGIEDKSHFVCNIREARAAVSRAEGGAA